MIDRRKFLSCSAAWITIPLVGLARSASANDIPAEGLLVTSVSWIDGKGLPPVEMFGQKSLLKYWPTKVVGGLAATRNARPKDRLPADFFEKKDFRAMVQYRLMPDGTINEALIDPGITPKSTWENAKGWRGSAVWAGMLLKDTGPHDGQKSALSSVVSGRLHPNSTLKVPNGAQVLSSGLIKFRAGVETNKAGIELAGSPYHVPWVWCEHAVVREGATLRLLGSGSRFPSHAWFIDNQKIGQVFQARVTMSDKEPAFTTGALVKDPKTGAVVLFNDPNNDTSNGPITSHEYTVAANPAGMQIFRIPEK